jgi:uncharacterized protein YegP (UPF0339 family)
MTTRSAKFELRRRTNGDYFFVLKASNGEPVATSEPYSSKQSAERGMEAMKRAAQQASTEDYDDSTA